MPEGISAFLQHVPMPPCSTFVDLGSGLGRIVLQIACSCEVQRCIGVELSETRVEQVGTCTWCSMQTSACMCVGHLPSLDVKHLRTQPKMARTKVIY